MPKNKCICLWGKGQSPKIWIAPWKSLPLFWLLWKSRQLWLELEVLRGWDESSHPFWAILSNLSISETRTYFPFSSKDPRFCAVSLGMRKDCSYGHWTIRNKTVETAEYIFLSPISGSHTVFSVMHSSECLLSENRLVYIYIKPLSQIVFKMPLLWWKESSFMLS